MDIGIGFLREGPLAFERDYLVPLPSKDMRGTCGIRAAYSDALGLTRELMCALKAVDSPEALLSPVGSKFWSEHSDRAGCTGWCASLGIGTERRGFLGRWAVTASADGYVRTAFREVENLQLLAAKAARVACDGGPDLFGEEEILASYHDFLLTRGVSGPEAKAQVARLQVSNPSIDIPADPLKYLDEQDTAVAADFNVVEAADEAEAVPAEGTLTPAASPFKKELSEAVEARAASDAAPVPEGFTVAYTSRKIRRLHFVGCCNKVPGEHYKVFDQWGPFLPPESDFDVVCGICFRGEHSGSGFARAWPGCRGRLRGGPFELLRVELYIF